MRSRIFLPALLLLAATLCATARAQLIHVSTDISNGSLLLKANHASTPWNVGVAEITSFDFTYDSQAVIGALDPNKNFWHLKMNFFGVGKFELTRPFDGVVASEQGLTFTFDRSVPGSVFEEFELNLVFNSIVPTEGPIPNPLPALGTWGQSNVSSEFFLYGGRSYFPEVFDLADVYGGAAITALHPTMTPIPEPSTYAVGTILLVGALVGWRKRSAFQMPS